MSPSTAARTSEEVTSPKTAAPVKEARGIPDERFYPPCPSDVPLAETSAHYKARVVLVLASLLAFVSLYVGLVLVSGYLVYLTIFEVPWLRGKAMILNFGAIACVGMLFLFLLKGLFQRRGSSTDGMVEVTEAEQPRLFAFLRALCRDAGSAMPGKVYLSHDVNAAVFYPRSLLRLVWPVRKNLLIGLGLVSALDLSELKAVLSHEFGHFSQSSMRLGQYVYVANGVVGDVVFGRDRWDHALRRWKQQDIRVSFPAWILAGVVWGLRKVLELAFRGINLANLSLSRQMEFNADLFAVRLAGSDAIVSGLWKAERAELAYRHAMGGLASVAEHGKFSDDVFAHLERSLGHLDTNLGKMADAKERFGPLLTRYQRGPHLHFTSPVEKVSALWESHPPNHEREANAKRAYVTAVSDERRAWSLFVKPKGLRKKLSRAAYEGLLGHAPHKLIAADKVAEIIEEERGEMHQPEHYHGLYENRIVEPGDIDAIIAELDRDAALGTLDRGALRAETAAFTGDALKARMTHLEELRGQSSIIDMLRSGSGKLKGKTAKFRGQDCTTAQIIAQEPEVQRELTAALAELEQADRVFFRCYYAATLEDDALREELVHRYRFLIQVQDLLKSMLRLESPIEEVLGGLKRGVELGAGDVAHIRSLFSAGREALVELAERAPTLKPPKLTLLDSEQRLDAFLLRAPVVSPLADDAITGAWIAEFMTQFDGATRRLRKLHFKNLGALLAVGERAEPTLFPKANPAAEAAEAPEATSDE